MLFRVEYDGDEKVWFVVQNSDDMLVHGFTVQRHAKRLKEFLNNGGAFDGDIPEFFCQQVSITDKDIA